MFGCASWWPDWFAKSFEFLVPGSPIAVKITASVNVPPQRKQ
jgi:hypothetical protein